MKAKKGSFAVTYTVRNEWDLLKYCVDYMKDAGAEKIFLFLDGTTDEARDLVSPGVEVRECVSKTELKIQASWIDRMDPAVSMDFRKRINTLYAAQRAKDFGIEWLICIDPDEIILPGKQHGSINEMLTHVDDRVDQIQVPNIELLPTENGDLNPFLSQTVFIKRNEIATNIWRIINFLTKKISSPRTRAKWENIFYRFWTLNLFPRTAKSPISGERVYLSRFLGYNNCKSFIRCSRYDRFNFNIHKWQKDRDGNGEKIKSIKRGVLLHYDLPNLSYYLKKFRQRSASMQNEQFYTRFLLGEIARSSDDQLAKVFYEQQLRSDAEFTNKLIRRGIATRITEVAEYFRRRA